MSENLHFTMGLLSLSVIFLAILFYAFLQFSWLSLCELSKCPFCYGTDLCESFEKNKITLRYDAIIDFIYNLLNVKNVYKAKYNNASVILKKLAHDSELAEFDRVTCASNGRKESCEVSKINDIVNNYNNKTYQFLNSDSSGNSVKNFQVCSKNTSAVFLNELVSGEKTQLDNIWKNIWTTVRVNVEPLLLQILNRDGSHWPVPNYYGACGRIIIEEDCGKSLTSCDDLAWSDRAYLAYQALEAAISFTHLHPIFRIYLTDISSDNIAVNSDIKLTFIDLENVILTLKTDNKDGTQHSSVDFADETDFVYSAEEICESSYSDHNVYAVCKLLLSPQAPWPMMTGGLLHSPPEYIVNEYPELFAYINICVNNDNSFSRFDTAEQLLEILSKFF